MTGSLVPTPGQLNVTPGDPSQAVIATDQPDPESERRMALRREDWNHLRTRIEKLKNVRIYAVTSSAPIALGVTVAFFVAFVTLQYVGLDTPTGRGAVMADSWVVPAFLIGTIVSALWTVVAYWTGRQVRSQREEDVDDILAQWDSITARYLSSPPTPDTSTQ